MDIFRKLISPMDYQYTAAIMDQKEGGGDTIVAKTGRE